MIKLMCNCPELQDGHVFKIGDYVYDKGMMHVFGWGSGGEEPRQAGGYIWSQCADKLQRIPTKKELIRFTKLKRNRKKKQYAKANNRYPALEEDSVIIWLSGGEIFLLDRFRINMFRRMMYWIRENNDDGMISIHHSKKSRKSGWWYTSYPPMDYFYLWIPSQLQIQTLLKEQWWLCSDHYVRTEFHRWYNEFQLTHRVWRLTSDEIWIAFYMHRVHNKVWKFKTKKKQWKAV